jgi:hypothetical protein
MSKKWSIKFYDNRIILALLLFFVLATPNVQSASLTVCAAGCNSTTIQGAIDFAGSGDTIIVSAGNYTESIIINKSLNLIGAKSNVDSHGGAWGSENITVINAGEGNNGILITASNVTVNGFKIIESGSDAEVFSLDFPFESAIYVYNEDTELENIAIIFNWIDNNYGSGIIIRYVNEPTIEFNYISNNGAGLWAAAGIGGQELTNGSFSHNEFFNSISYGIYIGGGKVGSIPKNTTGLLISYNDFHGNEKYGLQLYGYYEPSSVSNSDVRLEDNNFYDNGRCGIKITDFTNTIIKDNGFINNGDNGTSDKYKYGALISAYYTASGTQLINNTFNDNKIGGVYFLLELEGATLSDITAYHNNFLDGGFGVITATRGAFDFPFVINAENNWWGSSIPNSSNINGNVTYYPFCLNAGCATNIENEISEFTGNNTTNFSSITNWSEVELYLDSGSGDINWTVPVDLSGSNLLFSDAIKISYRKISVDSSMMPELDSPAVLTFKNSGFSNINQVMVLRNGIVCPTAICTGLTVSDGNIYLQVNSFSEYSLQPLTTKISDMSFGGVLILLISLGVLFFTLEMVFTTEKTSLENLKRILYTVLALIIFAYIFMVVM